MLHNVNNLEKVIKKRIKFIYLVKHKLIFMVVKKY